MPAEFMNDNEWRRANGFGYKHVMCPSGEPKPLAVRHHEAMRRRAALCEFAKKSPEMAETVRAIAAAEKWDEIDHRIRERDMQPTTPTEDL